MFDSIHIGNIKKISEAVTSILDTVRLCASKYSIEIHWDSTKTGPEIGKNDLINSGNRVKLL